MLEDMIKVKEEFNKRLEEMDFGHSEMSFGLIFLV